MGALSIRSGLAYAWHGGRVRLAVLAHELRLDDARDDHRPGPTLEDLGHLFADALERVEPGALHLVGDDFDVHPRQVLGERPASVTLLARLLLFGLIWPLKRIDVRCRALAQHRRQDVERELALGRRALTLLAHQPALELAVPLKHLEVQSLEAVPLLASSLAL